jgi:recombination protein RecR
MSAIEDLASELARLPGIGKKTALRLTYHLLRQPKDRSQKLAKALEVLAERVHPCPVGLSQPHRGPGMCDLP